MLSKNKLNSLGFSPIYIIIILAIILIIIGLVLIFSDNNKNRSPNKEQKVTTKTQANKKDETSLPSEEEKTDRKESSNSASTPSINYLKSTDALPDYDKLENSTLTRTVPQGWIYAISSDGIFELAYDPQIYEHQSSAGKVLLNKKSGGAPFSISVIPYDSGSRHQFIYKSYQLSGLNQIKTESTYEKNYIYNNRSGLGIYNIDLSATTTIGMLDIDGKKAYLFGSDTDASTTEAIISTLKILK